MRRDHWQRYNDRLDPQRDFVEIYGKVVGHEFPWDMNQALGFALFRTYAVPGIGRLLFEGVTFRDFPVVQGVVIIGGAMIVLVNLLVDILYAVIDPRIRLEG